MAESETIGPKTNIKVDVQAHFDALVSGKHNNFALFSCFLDGKPTSAICAINLDPNTDEIVIKPLFVAVTDDMNLTDHDGTPPKFLDE